jgi:N-sulfoglucosamine sulfohydrolase
MERRTFLINIGAAAAASLALPACSQPRRAAADRPNILFAIADDHGWPHTGVYGDKTVKTPTFDRLAAEGVLFTRAYCCAPTCTASRGGILTGQAPHRLGEGANLWSRLDSKFDVYPDLLAAAGYPVGLTGKGWGPGTMEGTGRPHNPAGPSFPGFDAFLKTVPPDQPFCFWFGSHDPHRPYDPGSGRKAGIDSIQVPPFLPDDPVVRSDIADYYFEVQRFDSQVAALLKALEASGRADNTIVVMTSDNGMPFPRAKANLYDVGTHMPLVVRWPAQVKGGREVDDFIGFADFAPTFLEAAGLRPPEPMTGTSFLRLLTGTSQGPKRDKVFVERERHAACRQGNVGYPCRAIRTRDFLYIRNFEPDRWPAGDPPGFGDIDGSPSKQFLIQERAAPLFQLACDKRPAEELYDLRQDPSELSNVADRPGYADAKKKLCASLDYWMAQTGDPRSKGDDGGWDRYPYFGGRPQPRAAR